MEEVRVYRGIHVPVEPLHNPMGRIAVMFDRAGEDKNMDSLPLDF